MKELAFNADYILPNITEACLLTGTEFRKEYDKDYIETLLKRLLERGAKNIILTGVSYKPGRTGEVICQPNKTQYYEHQMTLLDKANTETYGRHSSMRSPKS